MATHNYALVLRYPIWVLTETSNGSIALTSVPDVRAIDPRVEAIDSSVGAEVEV